MGDREQGRGPRETGRNGKPRDNRRRTTQHNKDRDAEKEEERKSGIRAVHIHTQRHSHRGGRGGTAGFPDFRPLSWVQIH